MRGPTQSTKAKIEMAKAHIESGKNWRELKDLLGYKHTQSVTWLLRSHGIDFPVEKNSNKGRDDAWDKPEADPNTLTHDELARAAAVGIRPARFAYLLQCCRSKPHTKEGRDAK